MSISDPDLNAKPSVTSITMPNTELHSLASSPQLYASAQNRTASRQTARARQHGSDRREATTHAGETCGRSNADIATELERAAKAMPNNALELDLPTRCAGDRSSRVRRQLRAALC